MGGSLGPSSGGMELREVAQGPNPVAWGSDPVAQSHKMQHKALIQGPGSAV